MITFTVTIQEEAGGKVRMHCETPPGSATPREINAGMEFKAKFKELQRSVVDRDWAHLTRPGRN